MDWFVPGGEVSDTMKKTRFITEAAIIAALYAVLTIINPLSWGQVQVRISEALTVLPFFTPAAIPGLFVGAMVSNIFGGYGFIDIIFGGLATLLAAFVSWKMPKKLLVPLPPVIINAIYVAVMLKITSGLPLLVTMGFVAIGEAVACYVLGYPLLLLLDKQKHRIFGRAQNL